MTRRQARDEPVEPDEAVAADDEPADRREPAEPAGMDLVHLLREVTLRLDLAGARFAGDNGLHPTDLRALISLLDAARNGAESTPGRLGERLGLNSAGTTALVDRLERLGLIRRVRDTRDRRRVLLEVNERAVTLGRSFFGPLIDRTIALLATFEAGEQAAIRRFLSGVRDAVGEG
ncbi:helix-turn-helix domain-containing protein [Streptomyces sp. DSM 41527]|uniref:Helix-turn-helix domain-containing protein n=1 Tax=Streptomyces mooreae TaxID=3075523 RepID=A0ABU2T1W5_9ACTN|nr:helix-turn-helix domain-containing protein [Streptomyces sp. DSM 41527]MDT0455228.1 helix-turn-helix domain-containing protein [Streptomyces sp. DSM 41527]